MIQKTITIEHPLGQLTLIARRHVPNSICRKTIRSIEGVLNAALLLAEEAQEFPITTKTKCKIPDEEQ